MPIYVFALMLIMITLSLRPAFAQVLPEASPRDIPSLMGSGNFNDARVDETNTQQYAALNLSGASACRIPVYPYTYYWALKKPTPERLDAGLLQAQKAGITPLILFEYYTKMTTPVGDYAMWHAVGKAFAERFRPNSAWWLSQGIRNYGVTVYTAFNEPDIDKPLLPRQVYHDALKGLADGVHDAGPDLCVVPGGLAAPNSRQDFTAAGLGPAIADLLNDGTLDGIDIHNYNGQWAPLGAHRNSAQFYFDSVKKASGITRDIHFYCTEFNYQQKTGEIVKGDIGDAAAASYFLTMIWDHLGVAGNDGKSATRIAFAWNLFQTTKDPDYAMCETLSPWTPNARGKAYQIVAQLGKGMTFRRLDPGHSGSYVLAGGGKTMWVWQDRDHWTSFPGKTCSIAGVPAQATEMRVYGWDGLRKTISLHKGKTATTVHVDALSGNETYIFVANAVDDGDPATVQP